MTAAPCSGGLDKFTALDSWYQLTALNEQRASRTVEHFLCSHCTALQLPDLGKPRDSRAKPD